MKKSSQQNTSHFNWGTGLTLVIVTFIAATLGVVGFIVSLDFHLVADNHYEKAVNYQDHIDRVEQADGLSHPVEIDLLAKNHVIQLFFPSSISRNNLKGTVELYRPSDASLDHHYELSLDENGAQHVPVGGLAKGKWQVKIYWTADGKSFYKQETIFL